MTLILAQIGTALRHSDTASALNRSVWQRGPHAVNFQIPILSQRTRVLHKYRCVCTVSSQYLACLSADGITLTEQQTGTHNWLSFHGGRQIAITNRLQSILQLHPSGSTGCAMSNELTSQAGISRPELGGGR